MQSGVRHLAYLCRAPFFALIALLGITNAGLAADSDYRLAAVIAKGAESMALVENASGEQSWYRIGDDLGDFRVVDIDADGITVVDANGESRLTLDAGQAESASSEQAAGADLQYQSRSFQYTTLLSQINATTPARGESADQAIARGMNRALGLAELATITAINHVDVATPSAARAELASRLHGNEAFRISINNDAQVLYVVPD
jgi:hypothetical protein